MTTDTRTYQDTNRDPYPDRITGTLGINGRNWTSLNNALTGTLTNSSPLGRTITRNYDPSNLLTQNQTVPGLLPHQLRLRHPGEDDLHHDREPDLPIIYDKQGNIAA